MQDINPVVTGSHGGGGAHKLMGRLPEKMARRAPASVLTVPLQRHELIPPDEPAGAVPRG